MTGPCVSHQLRGWTGLVYMWGQGLREQEKYARALKAYNQYNGILVAQSWSYYAYMVSPDSKGGEVDSTFCPKKLQSHCTKRIDTKRNEDQGNVCP